MALSAGMRLGPYEILAPIGAGGMGEVYKARDTRLNREVAVKVSGERFSDRFEREARAVSSLNHPHICTLHDLGSQDGVDYVVMEYLEGETLAQRLKKGPLPSEQVLEYAIQITDALDTAHRHGVIHRDVKPGNIMLTKKGAKLLDFGLAKMRGGAAVPNRTALPTETTPLTGEGMILGTVQYMAPEQLEGKEADAQTDLFALGAVVYEMATGKKAFEGASQASLISAIMTSEPLSISAIQSMSPPALDHVVRTCLAKDPDMRWSTAHDVLVELKWIVAAGSRADIPKPIAALWKRREAVSWAVTAVISLAFLILAFTYVRQRKLEPRPWRFSLDAPDKVTLANYQTAGPAQISPDGATLAFVGVDDSGKRQLYIRALDALSVEPLAGTTNVTYPFWSPNSRYLAFFADGKLKRIAADGGLAQVICHAPNGRGGSWGRDLDGRPGTIVFAPDHAGVLLRVSSDGGQAVAVTSLDGTRFELSHRQPEFLPDGHHFVYVATSSRPENEGIFVADLQSTSVRGNVRQLMSGNAHVSSAAPGYLLFVRDNKLLAQTFDARRTLLTGEPFVVANDVAGGSARNTSNFSVSSNGVLVWRSGHDQGARFGWFDRSGKQVHGFDAQGGAFPALSPEGNRVTVTWASPAQGGPEHIWVADLNRGSLSRLTFGIPGEWWSVWSPDGRRIVFGHENAEWGLYVTNATGNGVQEALLKTGQVSIPTDWSPDGRYILFTEFNPNANMDIWALPMFGNRKPLPIVQTDFNEAHGRFSPDGHWIAYTSDESGRPEIYVRPFMDGGAPSVAHKSQVSTSGGIYPRWRRDGRELFFRAPDGKLMSAPVKTGSTFEAGVPVALFDTYDRTIDLFGQIFAFEVATDGRRFLMYQASDAGAARPVNICLNWLARMKK